MNRRPTLIIAGAGKSGSTTLWRVLAQHPDIAMSISKEPAYFYLHFDEDIDAFYAKQFAHASTERVLGEATIGYLSNDVAPERIRKLVPDVRLLFILRNPVSRAISHYHWRRCHGMQRATLEQVVAQGDDADEIDQSRYGTHLLRWYELFDRAQMHVITTDALGGDAAATIRSIFEFVDVDADHPVVVTRENGAVEARSEHLARGVRTLLGKPWVPPKGRQALYLVARQNRRPATSPDVDPALAQRLYEILEPEIGLAEQLSGLDLSSWRRPAARR